jgi:hypothetical protein
MYAAMLSDNWSSAVNLLALKQLLPRIQSVCRNDPHVTAQTAGAAWQTINHIKLMPMPAPMLTGIHMMSAGQHQQSTT